MSAPTTRGRLGQQAYEALKERLLTGQFRANETVSLDSLAREIHLTRQPVTEAVKRLANEGLLEILPQVGCRIVVPDPQEVQDFFQLFSQSEGLLAALAATRRLPTEISNLSLIHAQLGALLKLSLTPEERAASYRLLNRRYHMQIHRMARSPTIAALVASFWDRADLYIATARRVLWSYRLADAHREHDDVRLALDVGDPQGARAAMEQHILEFGEAVRASLAP